MVAAWRQSDVGACFDLSDINTVQRILVVSGARSRAVVWRRFCGVHSAMGRSQPSREMPGFDFSEAAIDAYKAIPLHIRQIFAEYTPIIEPLSLDEAYLDVTENLAKHI